MRVELLFWDADPEYMTARQRLVEVLIEDAFETPIQMIAVATEQDAEFLALPGSPTIRIDGADIDPVRRRGNGALPADLPGRRRRWAAAGAVQGPHPAGRGACPRLEPRPSRSGGRPADARRRSRQ